MKVKTYTDHAFLDSIFSNVPTMPFGQLFLEYRDEIRSWNSLFDLIFHKSELSLLNCNKNDIIAKSKTNPYFSKLINQSLSGGVKLNFSHTTDLKSIDWKKIPLGSLHFYPSATESMPKNLLISNFSDWKSKIIQVSAPLSFQVANTEQNNNFPGWKFLQEIALPCDAAIIFDRYLLKSPADLKNNLFEILLNMIPRNLESEFQLTIMVKKSECQDFIKSKNRIEAFLKEHYQDKVKLGIVLADHNLPHDREILTNYYRISSGNSFNYYSHQGKLVVNTKLDFNPILSANYENYVSILNELSDFIQGKNDKHGLKRNKLFELVRG